jgi:ribose-phosphate pyrophosphokinase
MIRSLNLDGMFVPTALPEIEFKMIKFDGGESHPQLNNNIDYSMIQRVVVTHRIRSGDHVMELVLACDAIRQKGVKSIDLILPKFPYAQQDRVCAEGDAFSLKVFANIINSINADKVYILDAHSGITTALVNNCKIISNQQYVKMAVRDINDKLTLISPDTGSKKKSDDLFDDLECFTSLIQCGKKRDRQNGKLSGFEVFADNLHGEKCLIVDDICLRGGTFEGIAEQLKQKNAGDLYLYISHAVCSNGFDGLAKYFKKVYCTNSFQDIDHPLVKQFKIQI